MISRPTKYDCINRFKKLFGTIENGRCHTIEIRIIEEQSTSMIVSFIDRAKQVLDVTSFQNTHEAKDIANEILTFCRENNIFNAVIFCGGNGKFSYKIENVQNLI